MGGEGGLGDDDEEDYYEKEADEGCAPQKEEVGRFAEELPHFFGALW